MRTKQFRQGRTISIMSKTNLIIETHVKPEALELTQSLIHHKPMLILFCTKCDKITLLINVKTPSTIRCAHCGRTFTIDDKGIHCPPPTATTSFSDKLIALIHRP